MIFSSLKDALDACPDALSASEIVAQYAKEKGHELHPTNVGQAAKRLKIETITYTNPVYPASKPLKLYLVADLPALHLALDNLVSNRAQYTQYHELRDISN